jgi:hypothetical protein
VLPLLHLVVVLLLLPPLFLVIVLMQVLVLFLMPLVLVHLLLLLFLLVLLPLLAQRTAGQNLEIQLNKPCRAPVQAAVQKE